MDPQNPIDPKLIAEMQRLGLTPPQQPDAPGGAIKEFFDNLLSGGNIARVGGGIAGGVLGTMLNPGAGTIAGASLGSGAGEALAELIEGKGFHPGQIGSATIFGGLGGMIPGAGVGAKLLPRMLAGAGQGAILSAGQNAVATGIDEQRLPTVEELLGAAAGGGVLGAGAGGVLGSKIAQRGGNALLGRFGKGPAVPGVAPHPVNPEFQLKDSTINPFDPQAGVHNPFDPSGEIGRAKPAPQPPMANPFDPRAGILNPFDPQATAPKPPTPNPFGFENVNPFDPQGTLGRTNLDSTVNPFNPKAGVLNPFDPKGTISGGDPVQQVLQALQSTPSPVQSAVDNAAREFQQEMANVVRPAPSAGKAGRVVKTQRALRPGETPLTREQLTSIPPAELKAALDRGELEAVLGPDGPSYVFGSPETSTAPSRVAGGGPKQPGKPKGRPRKR